MPSGLTAATPLAQLPQSSATLACRGHNRVVKLDARRAGLVARGGRRIEALVRRSSTRLDPRG